MPIAAGAEDAVTDRRDQLRGQLVEAAIRTFLRFGARKTSMADIAAEAGVSRQTLYDLFGTKDELVVRSILHVTEHNLDGVREALARCRSLSERLDAYFEGTVVRSFELLREAGDAEDLLGGHNEAGRGALAESHRRHEALVRGILEGHASPLARRGLTVADAAHFAVTTVMGFKHGAASREDLDGLLAALKAGVLLLAEEGP